MARPVSDAAQARADALQARLSRLRTDLIRQVPFFGHLLFSAELRVTFDRDDVPTAAVTRDGTITVNHAFARTLSDAELAGVLVHEVMHVAYLWWDRRGERDPHLWNIAHDHAINLLILEMAGDEVRLPKGRLANPTFRGCSAEEIYDHLALAQQLQPIQAQRWAADDLRETLDGDPPTDGRDLERVWQDRLRQALRKQIELRGLGSLPDGLRRLHWDLREPKVSWQDVLARWVGTHARVANFTYSRPSRRSESIGEILPSLRPYGLDEVTVLWDASGSMLGREREIMDEVIGLCQEHRMRVRCIGCDDDVRWDARDVETTDDIPFRYGGGSDFRPAFDRLEAEGHTGVVVAFTDGAILVPDTQPPTLQGVLWIVKEGEQNPTGGRWGELVQVDRNGFVRDAG